MQRAKPTDKGNTSQSLDKKTCLRGWVNRIRNLGKIMFFDLQYANEQTQVAVKDRNLIKEISLHVRNGDLIMVKGKCQRREVSCSKKKITEIPVELLMESWKMINKTTTLPFEIKDNLEIKENNKYHYRYLDLRRTKSKAIIISKHKLLVYIRNFLHRKNFIEIETPILSQNSPEGAKTFTVDSKVAGRFYTLPQSPQIFKQILMIGGFDKYYQIAKSFRNEDARSNRQPEFLQLDLEMSFTSEKKIFRFAEKLLTGLLKEVLFVKKEAISFQRMEFDNCIEKYGTDKPDLRNPLEIVHIKEESNFPVSLKCTGEGYHEEFGMYIPINTYSSELITFIEKRGSEAGRYSLFEFRKGKQELVKGAYARLSKNYQQFSEGFYLIVNGSHDEARRKLLEIRKFCNKFFLNKEIAREFKFLWITKWPLFKYSESEKKIISLRHPFTMPKEKDLPEASGSKSHHLFSIRGCAYDLVCNGEELASGSLRIFRRDLQEKVFRILGFSKEEIEEHFGYFLKALEFAAPPHGGVAFGIERILAVFLNLKSLKETIAFPKNIDGSCSLTGAPNKLKYRCEFNHSEEGRE